MRWTVIICLMLAGCAEQMPPPVVQNQEYACNPADRLELENAVTALLDTGDSQPLDQYVISHPADSFGRLAENILKQNNRLVSLQKQQLASRDETRAEKQKNLQLNDKLSTLRTQLNELTRSLIEQESRQP